MRMRKSYTLRFSFLLLLLCSFLSYGQNPTISGELKTYHKITFDWQAIQATETPATYTDLRFNMIFTSPTNKVYVVPGYFAADGNAAESSASSGNIWRCHFNVLEEGSWTYEVSFKSGNQIAANLDLLAGTSVSIDGTMGSFTVGPTDKGGKDFRSKGRLQYVDEHFLQWTDGDYFLKLGTNSPEILLFNADFDNTASTLTTSPHIQDWNTGDPTWQGVKGKGTIGAINYVSEQDLNVHYFVIHRTNEAMSPWVNPAVDHYTYDVSKLAQWQIVMDHMMEKGVMAHIVMGESLIQSIYEKLGDAEGDPLFADSRKIYYREMMARFGYLNALTWNIGEEHAWDRNDDFGDAVTADQIKSFAQYISDLAYYNDHIVVHNGPANNDNIYNNLMGANSALTGTSLQGQFGNTVRATTSVKKWRTQSEANGKKWVVTYDEAYNGGTINNEVFRHNVLWTTLTSGGAGVEHYATQGLDVSLQDYRFYQQYWNELRFAGEFFKNNNIPFWEMENRDELLSTGYVLGKDFNTYVVYLPEGGTAAMDLAGEYSVQWFDPRNGGALQLGNVSSVQGGTQVSLGNPPNNTTEDWVILLRNTQTGPVFVTGIELSPESQTIGTGFTYPLTAQVIPANADNTVVNWQSSNTSVATVDANGIVSGVGIGTATITASTDDGGYTDQSTITVVSSSEFCQAAGTIKMERYEGIGGTSLSDLYNAAKYPDSPDFSAEITSFEIPTNILDNYGTRVSGYLCPPESGTYYFWVSGDDNTVLNLSTDADPSNKVALATIDSWSSSREWNKFASQKSVGIFLEVGGTYYIEALMKEGSGGDNLAVGWRKPSDGNGTAPVEVIPGNVLSPDLESTLPELKAVTGVSLSPGAASIDPGQSVQLSATVSPADATNPAVSFSSSNTNVAGVDSNGVVNAFNPGTTIITVTTAEGGFTATANITVNDDGGVDPPIDTPVSFAQSEAVFDGIPDISAGTSLMFGPDGRLYVAEYQGKIKIYTFERTEAGEYMATALEELSDIQNTQDHNDDGSPFSITNRETIGIAVAGTASNPVFYVTHSDFRIGGGGGGGNGDLGLDTNSGIITRFTWNGGSWDVVDIVRGLPRSEENHATNGLEYTTINGKPYLIVAQGGHTNGGGPSTNFAFTTEYALSAAVLSVDLDMINSLPVKNDNGRSYIYDLPTLDDPTRPNVNGITDPNNPSYDGVDVNDPFGGNDGLNQAIWDPNGPVQIYSPGYRNAYDLVVTESGALYITDNGANGGWGGFPENEGDGLNVTNNYVTGEPGSSSPSGGEQINNKDHLIKITSDINTYVPGSFYGGHPNPVRANPTGAGLFIAPNTSGLNGATFRTLTYDPDGSTAGSTSVVSQALPANWPPISVNLANPVEGDWRGPGEVNPDGPEKDILTIWGTNTNGIDEYTASNFNGAMKGDLIAGVNTGLLRRVQLDETGGLAKLTSNFASGLGGNALGITCNSDFDPFPGSIWVVTLNGKLVVLEPQDFVSCLDPTDPAFDPLADYDNDGYTNQDELDNGTDICNGGSQPNDFDKSAGGTLVSDLNDTDDDNDGILDAADVFQMGQPTADGSDAFTLPVQNELFSDNPLLQGYQGIGFTGMMNNGEANPNYLNWLDRRDDPNEPNPNDILGGAIGAMTMQMTSGTALGNANNQEKAFQYGVQTASNTGVFTVQGSLVNFDDPLQLYGTEAPVNGELGIFIGDGTQSNYIKFVLTPSGLQALQELNDVPQTPVEFPIAVGARPLSGAMLYLVVDAATGLINLDYSFDGGSTSTIGTIQAAGSILTAIQDPAQDLAVGLIGSSNEANKELEGTWDLLNVFGSSGLDTTNKAIARINTGGAQVLSTDGDLNWASNELNGAQSQIGYSVNTGENVPGGLLYANRHSSIPDYIDEATYDALFAQERYDEVGGAEMTYAIPVLNGTYRVNLFFGNAFAKTNDVGERIFDVNLEGVSAFNQVDLVAEFGHQSGGMLSEIVVVTDGELNITFIHDVQNPMINAIEVVNVENDNFPIVLVDVEDKANFAGDTLTDFTVQAVGGKSEEDFTFSMTGQPLGISIDPSTGVVSGTVDANAFLGGVDGLGTYDVEVEVDKPSSYSKKTRFQWVITGPLTISPVADVESIVGSEIEFTVVAQGGNLTEEVEYALSGAPEGISINSVTGVVSGIIGDSAATGGIDANGTYQVTLTASQAGGASTTLVFTWSVQEFPVILYRVNAAGQSLIASDSAVNWEANTQAGADAGDSYTVNTGENVASGLQYANRHESIPFYIDESTFNQLFAEERYDLNEGEEMTYSFPVENGNYAVNLYLGNSYVRTNDPGDRVYDIQIEGNVIKDNLDLVTEFGHQKGGMLSFEVLVQDGVLNITFLHEVENPLINAIEVIGLDEDKNELVIAEIPDQINFVGDVIGNLAISASGGDPGKNFLYTIEGQPLGIEVEPTNGLIYGTIDADAFVGGPNNDGYYTVKVKVYKNGSFPHTQYFDWNITGPLTVNTVDNQVNRIGEGVSLQIEAAGGDRNEEINFEISGAPEGVQINAASGAIGGTISSSAFEDSPNGDGIYTVTVTVSRPGSDTVTTQFEWKVNQFPTVLYRINAAGDLVEATDGIPDWEANDVDGVYTGQNYSVNTGLNFPSNLAYADRDESIPFYIDQVVFEKIFKEERYDSPSGEEMSYSIPVANGQYEVHLYVGNSYLGTALEGKRVFSIQIEEEIAFANFDPIVSFGHKTGGMLSYSADVTDGQLDITFLHNVENPIINAIEIATFDSSLVPILVNPIANQNSEPGRPVNLDLVEALGGDESLPFTYGLSGQPAGITIDADGIISGTLDVDADFGGPNGDGVYPVELTVGRGGQNEVTVNFVWTVSEIGWSELDEDLAYTGRHECSFVQAGDQFILFGGRENPTDVDIYDFKNNSWNTLKNSPPKEFNHFQAVEYNGLVWVIGAFKDNIFPNEIPAEFIWTFNPASGEWMQGPKIPVERRRGSAGLVVHNDKFYVVGGNTVGHNGGYVDWFDMYDPATGEWTVLEDAPRARDHFHAAVVDNKLYAAGGRLSGGPQGTFKPLIAEVDVFDFETNTWTTLSKNLPTPRGASTAVNFRDQLVIIGGEVQGELVYGELVTDATKITEAYDPQADSWTRLPDMNFERHGTQAIVSGDGVFILAGSNNLGGGNQKNMEVLGYDDPQGEAGIASTLTVPEMVNFASGETKSIDISALEGNIGIIIDKISLSGSEEYTWKNNYREGVLLRAGETISPEFSLNAVASPETALLTIEYNGGQIATTVLTTESEITGLVNPNDQYSEEGQTINLPVIKRPLGVVPSFSASNLPPNLSIDGSTGVISGTLNSDTLNGTFLEEEGLLMIEAESGTLAGDWFFAQADGENAIQSGGNHFNDTGGGTINYSIRVNEPGVYRFIWNSAFTGTYSGNNNDSWVKFDNDQDVWFFGLKGDVSSEQEIIDKLTGDQTDIVFPKGSSRVTAETTPAGSGLNGYFKVYRVAGTAEKFSWGGFVNDEDSYDVYVWFVNPGDYTFEVKERSAGHRIDKMALYKVDWQTFIANSFDAAEQSTIVNGLGGAANGSPYAVTVDYSDETGSESVSFNWYVGEPGDNPGVTDPCVETVVLSSDDFESGFGNWTDGGDDAKWINNAQVSASGSYSIGLQDNTNTSVITSQAFDLSEYNEVDINFNYYVVSFDNANEDFWFQMSTDGGVSFTTIEEWNLGDEFENNSASQGNVKLVEPLGSNVIFRFRADASGNADDVYLDDIVITGCKSSVPVQEIHLNPELITLLEGEIQSISVTVLPVDATDKNVLFTSSNPAIATVDATGNVTGVSEGEVVITGRNVASGVSDTVNVTVLSDEVGNCVATGTIKYERFEGISGVELSQLFNSPNYPLNPSYTSELTQFQAPINVADNYGARISGYLCPPESGTYYFWLSGDDHSQLNLSTDENPANVQNIASFVGWTSPQQWNKFPEQKSVGISLQAGKTYYIEAFVKEGGGGDNLAVGWRRPSDGDGASPVEVIPGAVLSAELIEVPDCDFEGGPPVVEVTVNAISCTGGDGGFTFSFDDNANRTNIEFSLDGGQTYSYNVSDNIGSTTVNSIAPGEYELWVRWGNDQCPQYLGEFFVVDECGACNAEGFITMERYDGIGGTQLSNLFAAPNYPDNPSLTQDLNSFEIPINVADNYGARVRGTICAPETGTYYFWVSGDDESQLNLGTEASEESKVNIANVPGWTSSRQWNKYSVQKSGAVNLVQGQTYYIEAFMKEGGGGDNLAVGWRKPSDGDGSAPAEIIPGSVLSPYTGDAGEDCDWTFAGNEGEALSFSGTKTVRYGANGVFVEDSFTDGVACNNSTFGDPLVGVVKYCEICETETTPEPQPCDGLTITQSDIISFAGGQDLGTATAIENNTGLTVQNNAWKAVLFDYNVTASTILEFEFKSDIQGEQHAIGLTSGNGINQPHAFTLYGTQVINDDISDFQDYQGGGYKKYVIPVGQFYMGQMDRIFFTADHDLNGQNGDSSFRNIKVYEEGSCAAEEAITAVSLTPGQYSLYLGNSLTMQASVEPASASADNLVWSSSNTAIATVNGQGVVSSIAEGVVVITASSVDGNISDSATITVTNAFANCTSSTGPPITTVGVIEPSCGSSDGGFVFTYEDHPNRTNIEFSINGGTSYPYNVVDTGGSTTVNGLAEGTYSLWVRWGNNQCPVYLGEYTLGEDCPPAPVTLGARIEFTELALVPNPAVIETQLILNTNTEVHLSGYAIYDVTGRLVARRTGLETDRTVLRENKMMIPLNHPPGMYSVRISLTDGSVHNKRILVR